MRWHFAAESHPVSTNELLGRLPDTDECTDFVDDKHAAHKERHCQYKNEDRLDDSKLSGVLPIAFEFFLVLAKTRIE